MSVVGALRRILAAVAPPGVRVRTRSRGAKGFTLVEVLVALVVLAVGLGAAMRAVSAVTTTSAHLDSVLLALTSAENTLAQARLEGRWPPLATVRDRCDQGRTELICEQVVAATANPHIRSLTVNVYRAQSAPGGSGGKLATVVGIIIESAVL